MKLISHISRYLALAVLLHLLLALAPAMAQTTVRVGETSTLSVQQQGNDTYMWTLYDDPTVDFAVTPGTTVQPYAEFTSDTNKPSVSVLWKIPGTYFFKVNATDITGCANNLRVGIIQVISNLTATMTSTTVCVGEAASITVELTGTAPWSFTYTAKVLSTGATSTNTVTGILASPYELNIVPNPKTTTEYTITSITDKWGTNNYPAPAEPPKVIQEVTPKPNSSEIYKYEP